MNKIADFMQSPTQLETEQLYPLNAYGSAMSPLFINLTLWIGVFMLMVIVHIEVDDEEIRNLTIAQRFLGRGILFAIMVSLQAIVCVTGCLFLGVQAENVAALYMTAVACSLTYLAIQYTLSTTLQHGNAASASFWCLCKSRVRRVCIRSSLLRASSRRCIPSSRSRMASTLCANASAVSTEICGLASWACFCVVLRSFPVHRHICAPFLTNLNRMFAKQLAEAIS